MLSPKVDKKVVLFGLALLTVILLSTSDFNRTISQYNTHTVPPVPTSISLLPAPFTAPSASSFIDLSPSIERHIFSQNGEDGILIQLCRYVYDHPFQKHYVEFGTQDGSQCNTRILRELFGWNGILMDGSNVNPNIQLFQHFITRENIISLFILHEVPQHFNLLSIDVDYNDFYVLYEIVRKYTMDIIVLEYNASLDPESDKIVVYGETTGWDGSDYFSASLGSYQKLLNNYGYSLVSTDSLGVNAFFVRDEIIQSRKLQFQNINNPSKLYNSPKYWTGKFYGHHHDPYNRGYITYEEAIKEADQARGSRTISS